MVRKAIVLLLGFFIFALAVPQISHAESMLTWDAVADAQGYKIYYGTSSGSYIYSKDVGSAIQYPLVNLPLEEGTTYYFTVRAYNDAGESDNSSEASYTVPSPGDTTPPLAPQGVTAGVSDVNITLSWKANTESDIAGYKVYYGSSSRSYGPSIPAGKVTNYTVDNLEPGNTYYLAVSALDAAENESGYSLEVVQTIPSADGGSAPGAGPMLQWDPAAGAVGYNIYYGTSPGSYPYSKDVGNVTQYPLSDLSLSEGKTYYFTTSSYSDAGESDISNEASYTTGTSADTSPPSVAISGPTSGSTYETSSASVNLSGNASDNIGVSQVNWTNSSGGGGVASGTTAWSISGIDLSAGENTLTVTAEDAAGNQSTDTLIVMYTPLDTVTPAVLITSPVGSPYETSSSSANLTGNASDNVGVAKVTWTNSKGASGTASGTASWSISGISLSEGDNVLTVTAKDAAGNQSSDTLVVNYTPVDTTKPVVSIASPTSGSTYATNSSSINISGSASDNMAVAQVVWSNSQGGFDVASGTTSWSITDVDLAEGSNVITVTATDAAGNEASRVLTVTYTAPDTASPAVSITVPTTGNTYETDSASINLSGNATDNVGVSKVTWVNSRGGIGTASGTTSWSISGITLLSGGNVLTVTAKDAAGNQSTDTLTVAYSPPDTANPAISITSPTSSSTYTTDGASFDLSGSASDNVSVSKVTWVNSKGGSGTASGTTSWSITGIALSEGDNVLTVTAKDAAGNQSTDTLTVAYSPPAAAAPPPPSQDTTAPVIEITSPTTRDKTRTKDSSVSLAGSASDNVGVTQVTWTNSTGGSGTASGTSSWSISNISLSKGDNILTVTATDAAGNQSTDTLMVTKK